MTCKVIPSSVLRIEAHEVELHGGIATEHEAVRPHVG